MTLSSCLRFEPELFVKLRCASTILTQTPVFELIVAVGDQSQDFVVFESVLLVEWSRMRTVLLWQHGHCLLFIYN